MSATRFTCFGGDCEVRAGGADAAAAVAAARRRMLAWHDQLSRFRPGSELSRLNADPRAVVPASPELVALAAAVAAAGERTGGLVDGTLAREIAAAGYRTAIGAPVPLALALRLAPRRAPAGPAPEARWRAVGAAGGAVLRPPGAALDSGGLAKGLFADLVADGLAGRPGVVVACAGDLRLAGTEPRPVRVASPFSGAVLHTFHVAGGGVATSGISRRSWLDARGRPAHHLLDPATGRPAFTGVVQATALAPTALEAEVLAKAAVLAGPGAGRRWLPHGGVIVHDDGGFDVVPARAARVAAAWSQALSPLSGSSQAPPTATAEARRMSSPASSPAFLRYARPSTAPAPQIDVVVPVHDEEAALEASLRRLHRYLSSEFPFSWRIVVADNASTDATPAIAARLAGELPGVDVLRLDVKGRGRALRAAWSASRARVVCYMDVDLSTDLRGLLPLVAPLLSGHSDLAIGTRLAHGARVVRGPKREFISRSYNHVLHAALRARFSDAQCGFKAVRRDVLDPLLADVRDDGWFFDTELLVLAQRRGLRIHEVPVDWVDDPDSRVRIVRTAIDDLKGVARLAAASQIARFMGVGAASTLAYALLFLLLRGPLGAGAANAAALAVTALGNTAANRRLTFGLRGRAGLVRQHALGAVVFVLTLCLTSGALAVLHGLDADPPRALELAVLIAASTAATITRFVALRSWVFARRRHAPVPAASPEGA